MKNAYMQVCFSYLEAYYIDDVHVCICMLQMYTKRYTTIGSKHPIGSKPPAAARYLEKCSMLKI